MATNDGGHEPRSYGDMVMNEYLKGLAEIAKEHPSKIEQLEALEKAATAGPFKLYRDGTSGRLWNRDGNKMVAQVRREEDLALFVAMRQSFPHLLAVAKAAKLYLSECREQNPCPCPILRKDYRDKLSAALSRLEAQ